MSRLFTIIMFLELISVFYQITFHICIVLHFGPAKIKCSQLICYLRDRVTASSNDVDYSVQNANNLCRHILSVVSSYVDDVKKTAK